MIRRLSLSPPRIARRSRELATLTLPFSPTLATVASRRAAVGERVAVPSELQGLRRLPLASMDHDGFYEDSSDSVVGHVALPLALLGPLTVNGREHRVPFAVSGGEDGVATLNLLQRGIRLLESFPREIEMSAHIVRDCVTLTSVLAFETLRELSEFTRYVEDERTLSGKLGPWFTEASVHGRLLSVKASHVVGRHVFLTFTASTGDSVGKTMIERGTEELLSRLREEWRSPNREERKSTSPFEVVSLNEHLDSHLNLSGKYVVAGARVADSLLRREFNVGSHEVATVARDKVIKSVASKAVAGIFLATGQALGDRRFECFTEVEEVEGEVNEEQQRDLLITSTIPSLEVGTMQLTPATAHGGQRACLEVMGLAGSSTMTPGDNARRLAEVIAVAVMCGDLCKIAGYANYAINARQTALLPARRARPLDVKRTRAGASPSSTTMTTSTSATASRGVTTFSSSRLGGFEERLKLERAAPGKVHETFINLIGQTAKKAKQLREVEEREDEGQQPRCPVP